MRPFFGFYGGKWRDAGRYPAPAHDTIVEPFAGSAGYSVRHNARRVVLVDLDPYVAGVWRYLLRATPAEVLAIPDLPEGGTVDDLALCQEARWLVGFWLNKGNAAPCRSASAWMRSGKYPNSFWGDRVRRTIAGQLELVRHWEIHEGDYREAPVTGEATWFVDPPYRGRPGSYYRFGSERIDYAALAAWCRTRQGQVIACEASGAAWLPFEALAVIKTTRTGRKAEEAVWLA